MSNGGSIRYSVGFNVDKTGLNEIKASLQQLQQMSEQDLIKMNPAMAQNATMELQKIKKTVGEVDAAFSKAFNSNLGTLNVSKLNQELKKLDLKRVEAEFAKMGTTGSTAFRNLATQAMTTNTHLKQSHSLLDKMGKTMANTIKWGAASSVMNSFTSGVQQAYGYVKNLDRSLNDIRIVTGLSSEEMDKFAIKANKAAQALGQTTTNYTDAALIYYQQGLAGKEVEARAETTLKAANVTGQTGAEVSEQLTAVWNGYKVSAQETELYIDKLAAVAASTASDLEELSTGMSKVASAANVAGVDIDQLNATLSTVISVTRQAPETVGTAFKTIYARMGDLAVDGVDEFGTTLGSVSSKMKTMGIEVVDESGNLREMGTIVEEVAAKWDTWTEGQKQAAAVAMAGKRQYNNLIALFDNWEMYENSLLTSANAAGTLQRQQDIYMESTQAHLKTLKASAENLYDSILDPKAINTVADGLSTVANAAAGFVDAIGGGIPLLMTLGSIGAKVFSQQLATGIATFITNLQTSRENIRMLQAEAQIVQQFGGSTTDPKIQALVGMKEQILALDKSITNEERNQANEMIKQQNTLMTQAEQLQNQLNTAEQLHQKLTGVGYDTKTKAGQQSTLAGLEQEQKEFASLQRGFADYEKVYAQFKPTIKAGDTSDRNATDAARHYRDTLQAQASATKELIEMDRVAASEKEKLIAAYEKFTKVTKKGTGINLNNTQVLTAARELEQAYQRAVHVTSEEIKESIGVLKNHESAMKSNNAAVEQGKQSFNSFIKGLNFRAAIQQSINFVSSLGQVAMALNSVKGVFKIWKDDDLSFGDKALQTLTSLGFAIPMLASGLSALNNALHVTTLGTAALTAVQEIMHQTSFAVAAGNEAVLLSFKQRATVEQIAQAWTKKGISTELAYKAASMMTIGTETEKAAAKKILQRVTKGKMSTEAAEIAMNQLLATSNTKVTVTATTAGAAIQKFWASIPVIGQIAIIIGAITAALIGLTAAIKHAYNAEKRAVEQAGENLDNLNKELESVKQLTSDVQSNLDGWASAKETIKGLTKGTNEWKQALIETNGYVLALLSRYPELAQYITTDSNGMMDISQEGIDYLADSTTKDLENAQYASAQGQVEYLTASNDLIYSGKSEHFTDIPLIAREDVGELVQYGVENGNAFLGKSDAELKEMDGFEDPIIRSYVQKYAPEIQAGITDAIANDTAIDSYQSQTMSTIFADDEIYQNLDEQEQEIARNEAEKVYNDAYEDAYNSLNTTDEIRAAHKEDLGATDVRESETEGFSEYKVGDEWIEVSDDAARVSAASIDAAEGLDGFTSNLYTAGEGLLWFRKQLLDKNNVDIEDKEGNVTRSAMTENQATVMTSFKKGDTTLTGIDNLSDAELNNFIAGTNGKDSNDFNVDPAVVEQAGYTGENAVEEYLADLCALAREEKQAREEEKAKQDDKAIDAIDTSMSEEYSGLGGRKQRAAYRDAGGSEGLYNSIPWAWNEGTLPEGVTPEDIISGIDWSQAPDDPDGLQKWFQEQASQGIQNVQLDEQINDEGLDSTEIEDYGQHLQDIADIHEDIDDTLDEDPIGAKKIAFQSKRAEKGMEGLNDTLKVYEDVLSTGNTAADGWVEASNSVRENMSDILGISDEDMGWMTDDYIANNLEDIQKAAEGDTEAIQNMWAEAGKYKVMQMDLDVDDSQLTDLVDKVANEDLQIGATIDDSQYAQTLYNMMVNSGATAEEIQETFNNIGWEPEVEVRTEKLSDYDVKNGKVQVPGQVDVETGEVTMQEIPVTSEMKADDEITYTVIKGKNGKNGFTPNMRRRSTASVGSGNTKPSGGGGGGGGGSKPKKTYKTTEKKRDRYREVNNQLKELTTIMERLQKAQENLYGKKLLDNLKRQLKVLKDQVSVTKEKLKIARDEAEEMRTKRLKQEEPGVYNDLGDFGIKFDKEGNITNYQEVMKDWDKKVADMNAYWNSKSAEWQESEAGKKYAEKIERASQNRDTLQSLVEKYDEIMYDTIPGLQDEITEAMYQEIEIKIAAFDIEANLRLDVTEAIKNWYDFVDGIWGDSSTFEQMMNRSFDNLESLFDSKVLSTLTGDINQAVTELNKIRAGKTSTIYTSNSTDDDGNKVSSEQQALDHIAELFDKLTEQIENVYDIVQNTLDEYLESIDNVVDAMDEYHGSLDRINGVLEHTSNILSMINGEANYEDQKTILQQQIGVGYQHLSAYNDDMSYWDGQMKFHEANINAYEKEIASLEKQLNQTTKESEKEKLQIKIQNIQILLETEKEAYKTSSEAYMEAWENREATAEETLENIIALYDASVKAEIQSLDNWLTNNLGSEQMQVQWELNMQNEDKYLDEVNKAFEIRSLENKINQSINDTDSISAQKRLNKLKEEELEKLREKDKLTQYDVERANALYELELKKIALEEAQNNKSQMRLRRDASGNYSYQFVADENSVADAQREVDEATNNLYNMDKDQYRAKLEELSSVWTEYQDYMNWYSELSYADQQKYAEEYERNCELYQQMMVDSAQDSMDAYNNVTDSGFESMALSGQIWTEEMLSMVGTGYDEMMRKINGDEDSFKSSCNEAFEAIKEYSDDLKTNINSLGAAIGAGTNEDGEPGLAQVTNDYYTKATQLAQGFSDALKTNVSDVKSLSSYYATLLAQMQEYINKDETIKAILAAKNATDAQVDAGTEEADKISSTTTKKSTTTTKKPTTTTKKPTTTTTKKIKVGGKIKAKGASIYDAPGASPESQYYGRDPIYKVLDIDGKWIKARYHKLNSGVSGWFKKGSVTAYDTGGYTGDWPGKEGKMAMLHSKELVLNKKDTENILEAIKILRSYVDSIDKTRIGKIENLFNKPIQIDNLEALDNQDATLNTLKRNQLENSESLQDTTNKIITGLEQVFNMNTYLERYADILNQAMSNSITQLITGLEPILPQTQILEESKLPSAVTNIDIHADFPNANSSIEIEKAFTNLVNMATQRAYSNKK